MGTEPNNIITNAAREAWDRAFDAYCGVGNYPNRMTAHERAELQIQRALDAATAELRNENASLRELWTEMRVVLTQSRDANCMMGYGKAQHDAVEAANRVLNKMPARNTIDDASSAEWRAETFRHQLAAKDREIAELREAQKDLILDGAATERKLRAQLAEAQRDTTLLAADKLLYKTRAETAEAQVRTLREGIAEALQALDMAAATLAAVAAHRDMLPRDLTIHAATVRNLCLSAEQALTATAPKEGSK